MMAHAGDKRKADGGDGARPITPLQPTQAQPHRPPPSEPGGAEQTAAAAALAELAHQLRPLGERWWRRVEEDARAERFVLEAAAGEDPHTGLCCARTVTVFATAAGDDSCAGGGGEPVLELRDTATGHPLAADDPLTVRLHAGQLPGLFHGDTVVVSVSGVADGAPEESQLVAKDWGALRAGRDDAEGQRRRQALHEPEMRAIVTFLADALSLPPGLRMLSFLLAARGGGASAMWSRALRFAAPDDSDDSCGGGGGGNVDACCAAVMRGVATLLQSCAAACPLPAVVLALACDVAASPLLVCTAAGRGLLRPALSSAAGALLRAALDVLYCKQFAAPSEIPAALAPSVELAHCGLAAAFLRLYLSHRAAAQQRQQQQQRQARAGAGAGGDAEVVDLAARWLPHLEQFARFTAAVRSFGERQAARSSGSAAAAGLPIALPTRADVESLAGLRAADLAALKRTLATSPSVSSSRAVESGSGSGGSKARHLEAVIALHRAATVGPAVTALHALLTTGALATDNEGERADDEGDEEEEDGNGEEVPAALGSRRGGVVVVQGIAEAAAPWGESDTELADDVAAVQPWVLAELGLPVRLHCNSTTTAAAAAATARPPSATTTTTGASSLHFGFLGVTVGDSFVHLWILAHGNGAISASTSGSSGCSLVCHVLANGDTLGQLLEASAATNGGTPAAFAVLGARDCTTHLAAAACAARALDATMWARTLLAAFGGPYQAGTALARHLTPQECALPRGLLPGAPQPPPHTFLAEPWFDGQSSSGVVGGHGPLPSGMAISNSERNAFTHAADAAERAAVPPLDSMQLEALRSCPPGCGLRVVEGVVGSGKTRALGAITAAHAEFHRGCAKDDAASGHRYVLEATQELRAAHAALVTATTATGDGQQQQQQFARLCEAASKAAEEVQRLQLAAGRHGPVLLVSDTDAGVAAVLGPSLSGDASATLSAVAVQAITRSLRAPLVQGHLAGRRRHLIRTRERLAALARSSGILVAAARGLCGPKLTRHFATQFGTSAARLHGALALALPGSIAPLARGGGTPAGHDAPFIAPAAGASPAEHASYPPRELLILDRDSLAHLRADELEALGAALYTEQERVLHAALAHRDTALRAEVYVTFHALCSAVAVMSMPQSGGVLTATGEELLRWGPVVFPVAGPATMVIDEFTRLQPAHLFALPAQPAASATAVVVAAPAEDLSMAADSELSHSKSLRVWPPWSHHLVRCAGSGATVRLSVGKRFVNAEVAELCRTIAGVAQVPPVMTADVTDQGTRQEPIPGLVLGTVVWSHPHTPNNFRQLLHTEALMADAVWVEALALLSAEGTCHVKFFAPPPHIAALNRLRPAGTTAPRFENVEDHMADSCDVAVVVLAAAANSDRDWWIQRPRWLWLCASRASRGVVVIGDSAHFSPSSAGGRGGFLAVAVAPKVAALETAEKMWAPRAVGSGGDNSETGSSSISSSASPIFAVFPLHCPIHRKLRSALAVGRGGGTNSGSSVAVEHLNKVAQCPLPCMQPFAPCSASPRHWCAEPCHRATAGFRQSHGACPYPCPKSHSCGHPCTQTCGEPCGLCSADVVVERACGEDVVVGFDGREVVRRRIPHYARIVCGSDHPECVEPTERTCPQCGFTGLLPCSRPVPPQCNNCVKIKQDAVRTAPPDSSKDVVTSKALLLAAAKAALRVKKLGLECQSEGPEKNPRFVAAMSRAEARLAEQAECDRHIAAAAEGRKKQWLEKVKPMVAGVAAIDRDLEIRHRKLLSDIQECLEQHAASLPHPPQD